VTVPATLKSTAQALLTAGKGLLAADESFPTIGKRFKALDIPSTEESRRTYREMLFTTPGLNEFISGVIPLRRDDTAAGEGWYSVAGVSRKPRHRSRHQGG
jgi:fructose-bisphosphate aldolase class 1